MNINKSAYTKGGGCQTLMNGEGVTNGDIAPAGTCLLCLDLRVRERHLRNPTTPILSNNTTPISNNTSNNTFSRQPGFSWDEPGQPTTKKVPHRNGFGTNEDFSGLRGNGEGGIRTHEGVTPTRFRVVRIQPGSATSPTANRRSLSLTVDASRASAAGQPTAC